MALRVTKEPLVEPISLTEAKLHLRVDTTADDALITQLIRAARVYCENFQGRSYIVKSYERTIDNCFVVLVKLANPPVCYVDSITYIDLDGVTQTVSTSIYAVDIKSEPARVYEEYQQTWPSAVRMVRNTISVNYVAGYAAEFTADAGTDIITVAARTYTAGDVVRLKNSGGTLPAGLAADTDYYVITVSGNTFQLSLTEGGAAVDITDTGSGTNYVGEVPEPFIAAMKLVLGHLYENREDALDVSLVSVPMGAKTILTQDRVQWF